jgi:hypothetical protein
LFCEKGVGGLPLETRTSPVDAPNAVAAAISAHATAIGIAESFVMNVPPAQARADDAFSPV